MELEYRKVRTFADALMVRKIRNQCRLFMTRNTNELSVEDQFIWYTKYRLQHKTKVWVVLYEGVAIGYQLQREEKEKLWISGGLIEEYRGRGLGRLLFYDLVDRNAPRDVWLEVLKTNLPAYGLYRKLGFHIVEKKDDIYVMKKIF